MNWKNSNDQQTREPKGTYVLGLNKAKYYYKSILKRKEKPLEDSRIYEVFRDIVYKVMGEEIDDAILLENLNIDCIIGKEAEEVIQNLLEFITNELLFYFPRLGAFVPDTYYWLTEGFLTLIIRVPDDYEERRGIFF